MIGYFDLSELPGPMTERFEEMIAYTNAPENFTESYKAKYRAFQEKFNYLDDGKASARTVDRIFFKP